MRTQIAILQILFCCVFLSACTTVLPIQEPRPSQNLSNLETGELLTFDLRDTPAIQVEIQGEVLDLIMESSPASLLAINQTQAKSLNLKEIFFGLGTAISTDGDYKVMGKVVKTHYSIAGAEPENIWALIMDEDIHSDYDGAISFGAIPATKFRILLNDIPDNEPQDWSELVLERGHDKDNPLYYGALEFASKLALYQTPVTANRKASYYLNLARVLNVDGQARSFTRQFNNERIHIPARFRPAIDLSGFKIDSALVEIDEDGGIPGDSKTHDDVIKVRHDLRKAAYQPTWLLGRDFFKNCSEMIVGKEKLDSKSHKLKLKCRVKIG